MLANATPAPLPRSPHIPGTKMSEPQWEPCSLDEHEQVLPQRQPRAKRQRAMTAPSAAPSAGAAVPAAEAEGQAAADAGGAADEQGEGAPAPPGEELVLPEYRSAAVPGYNFEYLDHTADVQLHAWGANLQEAFENVGLAMFNYMTPLSGISIDESQSRTYEAEGHDLQSLLFQWLDELLFTFSTEFFVSKVLRITTLDLEGWKIVAEGRGETFNRRQHACGTEVKAITYSAMQINEREGDAEVFVIVDI